MFSLVSHIWTAALLKSGPKLESMKEFGISISFFLYILNTHTHTHTFQFLFKEVFCVQMSDFCDSWPSTEKASVNKLVLIMSTSV